MSECPGCRLDLPERAWDNDPRLRASGACRELYAEVSGYVLAHAALLGPWQQTTIDAYAAQHVAPTTPAIGLAFALNGLYLVLERGFTGFQVRDAHGYLANTADGWPTPHPPPDTGPLTVFDVAMAEDPDQTAAAIHRWGTSVWQAWRHAHAEVAAHTDHHLRDWRPVGRAH
ncbi:DUF5946 family protein [Catellatospora tritici]|uniref:DUF5946 family protein n=1 Tax=Catellatospora tritici TaxID=2851566 RepID=UPI001C2CC86F|nr:DUF5946 family protein [Catellatospora tritici]MBV1855274.1 hypothetical protein [Catellatospora tritici]